MLPFYLAMFALPLAIISTALALAWVVGRRER